VALTRLGEVFSATPGQHHGAAWDRSITQARTKGGMAIKVGALPTVSTRLRDRRAAFQTGEHGHSVG
jgi:hypothetical protein